MKQLTCISQIYKLVVTISHSVRSRFTPHSLVLFLSTFSSFSDFQFPFPFSLLRRFPLSNIPTQPCRWGRGSALQSTGPPASRRSSSTSAAAAALPEKIRHRKTLTPPSIHGFWPCSRREIIGGIPMSFRGRLSSSELAVSATAASSPAETYICTSE